MSAECNVCGHDLSYEGDCVLCDLRARAEVLETALRELVERCYACSGSGTIATEPCPWCLDARRALTGPGEPEHTHGIWSDAPCAGCGDAAGPGEPPTVGLHFEVQDETTDEDGTRVIRKVNVLGVTGPGEPERCPTCGSLEPRLMDSAWMYANDVTRCPHPWHTAQPTPSEGNPR